MNKAGVTLFLCLIAGLACAATATAQTSSFAPGNVLVSTYNYPANYRYTVYEYRPDGARVQAIDVAYPGIDTYGTESARDIVVNPSGRMHVYNGTFQPWLSTYSPAAGTWQHYGHVGWSTVNNGSYGGIAYFHNYVFVTDMFTYNGGEPQGIVRFDATTFSSSRFATDREFRDLTVGLDGLLYGLDGYGHQIHVYNPLDLRFIRTIELPFLLDVRGIAVNFAGEIFAAAWDDYIYHFDPSGTQVSSIYSGFYDLNDIDINVRGELVVGSRFGGVIFTDESLSSVRSFTVGDQNAFVAWTEPLYSIAGRVDENTLGIGGATVTLAGSRSATTTTDVFGYYQFAGVVPGGSYTVSASHPNYSLDPPTQSFDNITGDATANFAATRRVAQISGRIADSGGTGLSGVAVQLSGWQQATTVTDANGNYAFSDVAFGGGYSVTPSSVYYGFTPSYQSFSNLSGDQVADFVGTPLVHTIFGQVLDSTGVGLSGATVTLSGFRSGSAVSGDFGYYYFFDLPAGRSYTVTPSRQYYVFNPQSATATSLMGNVKYDFTGELTVGTIRGRVSEPGGAGMSGVTITLSGAQSATTQTDANGDYAFADLPKNAAYAVTPTKPGAAFGPASLTVVGVANPSVANFTLTSITLNVGADAYVRDGRYGGGNFGTATELITATSSKSGDTRWSYLKFNLGTLPSGQIASIKLLVFGRLIDLTTPNVPVAVLAVANASWSETGITWKNRPSPSSSLAQVTVTDNLYRWYELNVTSHVLSELNAGRNLVSLLLRNAATTTNYTTFNSKEASSNQPQLVISFQ